MNVYCLFCDTTKTDYVVRAADQALHCLAISPKQIQHTYKSGKVIDRIHQLLPGYVFLYSEPPLTPTSIYILPDIIRVMRNQEKTYELTGQDEAFAMMIREKSGVLGKTPVIEDDGYLTIKDGIFEGMNARILRVDRRYQRMNIEVPFNGDLIRTWLQYEIVEKKSSKKGSPK